MTKGGKIRYQKIGTEWRRKTKEKNHEKKYRRFTTKEKEMIYNLVDSD